MPTNQHADAKVERIGPPHPSVGVVRVVTPNGRIHVVITSLLGNTAFPVPDFADLYHRRWRIEEAFKRLTHRLALENKFRVFVAVRGITCEATQ